MLGSINPEHATVKEPPEEVRTLLSATTYLSATSLNHQSRMPHPMGSYPGKPHTFVEVVHSSSVLKSPKARSGSPSTSRRRQVLFQLQHSVALFCKDDAPIVESASRPLVGFGVLNNNLIKVLISFVKCISRLLMKSINVFIDISF
jgi:hypothetical protein